jgi:hypothetical protein
MHGITQANRLICALTDKQQRSGLCNRPATQEMAGESGSVRIFVHGVRMRRLVIGAADVRFIFSGSPSGMENAVQTTSSTRSLEKKSRRIPLTAVTFCEVTHNSISRAELPFGSVMIREPVPPL